MPTTLRASQPRTLWSLASMLPEAPERTLLYGLERDAVPWLAETATRPATAAYDAAIVVLAEPPKPGQLREIGASLRPGGRTLVAAGYGRSRRRTSRFGTSPPRLARLLERDGYAVERLYGLRPSLVLPEYVVTLTRGVSEDFWSNVFRPWSSSGALATTVAGRVPALGARAFPWVVVRARWQEVP